MHPKLCIPQTLIWNLQMASFKVLLCLSLHVLFLISSSGTRLFHPFSIADQAASTDKVEIIDRHSESTQFSGTRKLTLAVEVSDRNRESKQFPSRSNRALIEEGMEAIKASIQRHDGIPFESQRVSPGGPDPHHH